ncbi:MAG: hypothetical protein ACRDVE_08620 [Actinocrinis sp.]
MTEPIAAGATSSASGAGGPDAVSGSRRVDRILDRSFTADLPSLPLAELRQRRAEAGLEERDLSYLRRLLHGRLDIITAESARRAGGDQSPLMARLSEILADPPSSRVASARHLRLHHGEQAAGEYRVAMEAALHDLAVPDLTTCPDRTLREAAAKLSSHEREVSELRREVQRAADECAADLARRYREGEAAIDDLLIAER